MDRLHRQQPFPHLSHPSVLNVLCCGLTQGVESMRNHRHWTTLLINTQKLNDWQEIGRNPGIQLPTCEHREPLQRSSLKSLSLHLQKFTLLCSPGYITVGDVNTRLQKWRTANTVQPRAVRISRHFKLAWGSLLLCFARFDLRRH